MALKFLNKKGWHTGSLRNLEKVWKAEQKHDAEEKKLQELKVQIHKEREAEELRQLHISSGIAPPKQDRLEFLYDPGVGGSSSSKPSFSEENNPGKAAVELKKDIRPAEDGEKVAPAVPGALFTDSKPQSANDKWRKIHSDPLYLIKQQELAALDRIRKNPVKMQMLESQVRKNLRVEKDTTEHDGDSKRREKKRDRGDDKHGKKKKHHRDERHAKKRDRNDQDVKKHRSTPSPERKHGRKYARDESHERRHNRDGSDRKKHRRNGSLETS